MTGCRDDDAWNREHLDDQYRRFQTLHASESRASTRGNAVTRFIDQPATLETALYGSIAHLEVHARVMGETMDAETK